MTSNCLTDEKYKPVPSGIALVMISDLTVLLDLCRSAFILTNLQSKRAIASYSTIRILCPHMIMLWSQTLFQCGKGSSTQTVCQWCRSFSKTWWMLTGDDLLKNFFVDEISLCYG